MSCVLPPHSLKPSLKKKNGKKKKKKKKKQLGVMKGLLALGVLEEVTGNSVIG